MISHEDEYGADELDIEEVRARLEKALGITFVAHDSSFWNGLYHLWEDDAGRSIRIADNREGEPEGILYPWHAPAVTVVLARFVEPVPAMREGLAAVEGLHLLTSVRHDSSIVRPQHDHDEYGSSLAPGPLRARMAALLGLAFVPLVDDSCDGECHRAVGEGIEVVDVLDNRDPDPDLRYSPGHPEMMSIMVVHRSGRSAELLALLTGVGGLVHLRHDEY